MAELDEILSGKEPEPATETEQPRGPDGRWIPAAPPADSAPEPTEAAPESAAPPATTPAAPPPEPVEERVPQAALLDERRKRQQYERELAELRELMRTQQAPKPAEPPPPTDVWEDPAAYISAETKRAREEAVRDAQEMMRHQLANWSERMARSKYADYDQKRADLEARVKEDPVLRADLVRAISSGEDLGEYVYRTASRLQEYAQISNLDAFREKIRQEERAKLERELGNRGTPVPQSLNTTPSPATSTETWSGPPPLEEILKRK